MISGSFNQSQMSHLAKMTNFTALVYDLSFKLWLRQETAFRQRVIGFDGLSR